MVQLNKSYGAHRIGKHNSMGNNHVAITPTVPAEFAKKGYPNSDLNSEVKQQWTRILLGWEVSVSVGNACDV